MTKWWEQIDAYRSKPYAPYFIYQIMCTRNGKRYIGRTQAPKQRIQGHLSALRSNRHINKAMQKDFNAYGENYFTFWLLGMSDKEVSRHGGQERYWMEQFRTYDERYGYNFNDPGYTKR